MSIKSVLWVVPKYTFPISDGARVASDSLVQSFLKTNNHLDVLSLVDNSEANTSEYKEKWNAHNVYLIDRAAPKTKLNKIMYWMRKFLVDPFSPLTLSYFNSKPVIESVNRRVNLNNYDTIVLDGLHGFASIFPLLDNFKGKLIYRAHNVEQDLWCTAADKTKNILLSYFYRFQGRLMAKFENDLILKTSITWTISDEDQVRFKREVPSADYLTVPVGMNFSKMIEKDSNDSFLNLFFLGRLDWAPNKEGLKWFLDYVWPKLSKKRPDIRLNIGGSGDGDWIKPYLKNSNFVFHGLIDDLGSMYKQMDLAIMPIFFGSGTRIKVIESACYGLPMISTQMGVQGSGLLSEHYYHAESADDWIDTLSEIDKSELSLKSSKAWNYLKNILDYEAVTELINKSL